jgi:hypothetical protein
MIRRRSSPCLHRPGRDGLFAGRQVRLVKCGLPGVRVDSLLVSRPDSRCDWPVAAGLTNVLSPPGFGHSGLRIPCPPFAAQARGDSLFVSPDRAAGRTTCPPKASCLPDHEPITCPPCSSLPCFPVRRKCFPVCLPAGSRPGAAGSQLAEAANTLSLLLPGPAPPGHPEESLPGRPDSRSIPGPPALRLSLAAFGAPGAALHTVRSGYE